MKAKSLCFTAENEYETDLLDKLESLEGKYSIKEIFMDFLNYSALYISNIYDGIHLKERYEKMENLLHKYEGKVSLHSCLQSLTKAIQINQKNGNIRDILGTIFETIGLSNEYNGQFFTPENISRMMAKIMIGSKLKELEKKPYITVCDPCIGSGRMLMAYANEMQDLGYNYCINMAGLAVDIDMTCVFMSYVQLSLYGIPAVVIHGNSLLVEEWSRWYTPAYIWGGWLFIQHLSLTDKIPDDDLKLQKVQNEFVETIKQMNLVK